MKVCTITYEEALARHPNEVEEFILSLRRGKSKARLLPAPMLEWSYDTCVRIEGSGSLADILSEATSPKNRIKLTIDEQVADEVRRTRTALKASHGRWSRYASVPNPPEVATEIRARLEEHARERNRFDSLSPEEQSAERDELLHQLSGSPGFIVVQVPRRPG